MQRSISTLSEELRLNAVHGTYDPKKAHHKAYVRRKYSKYQGMKIVRNGKLRDFIEKHLRDDQSPEAVSGRLKYREKKLPYVSKNSIRRYIRSVYGRRIEAYRAKKKKRRYRMAFCANLQDRTFIDKRPKYIEKRVRVGDAEGDFITSGKSGRGIVLTIVDRKLRVAFLDQILQPSCAAVTRACLRIKIRYLEWQTMTTDNDILFQHHKALERVLNIRIFFCHPHHSYEKGSIENANKYIRRDIPKGSDISRYSKRFILKTEEKLNRRPMQRLRYRTPTECLLAHRKKNKKTPRSVSE